MAAKKNGPTIEQIDADIKNREFSKVYLLYGDESYLIRQYRDKLKKALINENDTMNYACFEENEIEEHAMIDLAETLPFFSDYRLIVVENSGFFKNANDTIADYLKTVPETTVLIFVEKEVDKRNRAYKAAKEYGRAVEVTQPDQDKIVRWIGKRLKDNQKMMNRQALQLFLEMTGSGMENMDKELEKLLCYTLEQGEITAQDVEEICVKQTTKQIFEMIDALSQKKKKEALTLYYDLLALKEAPVLILYLITRQFRILWKIKEMQKKRIDTKTMASALGIPEFAVRKNMAQANRFDTAWLRNKVESCVAYEEAVKTGKLNDKMAVEMVICGE